MTVENFVEHKFDFILKMFGCSRNMFKILGCTCNMFLKRSFYNLTLSNRKSRVHFSQAPASRRVGTLFYLYEHEPCV